MIKHIKTLGLASLLMTSAWVLSAAAQPQSPPPGPKHHPAPVACPYVATEVLNQFDSPRFIKKLNITPDQRTKIRALLDAKRDDIRLYSDQSMDAKKALKKAANPSKYQAARVKELANQQGQAMSQLILIQADLRHAVFQILTPEQQKQWISTKQKYKKKHRRPHP